MKKNRFLLVVPALIYTVGASILITFLFWFGIGTSYIRHVFDEKPYQCTFLFYNHFEKMLSSGKTLDQKSICFGFVISAILAIPLFILFLKGLRSSYYYNQDAIRLKEIEIKILQAK